MSYLSFSAENISETFFYGPNMITFGKRYMYTRIGCTVYSVVIDAVLYKCRLDKIYYLY